MLKVDISNFRNIRKANLHDDAKLSIVLGYNEDGKSSLCGAIQYAITGQAFGLRGDAAQALVTHGEDRMHVRLQIGDRLFNRTRTGGDPLKGNAERLGVTADVLPMLFNQKLIGDGGSKHMKAFLSGSAADRFDARIAFKDDPEMTAVIRQANTAGSITTKQLIAYCERMRAAQQKPPSPVAPAVPFPSDAELGVAAQSLKDQQEAAAKAAAELAETEKLVAALSRLAAYYPAKAAWDELKAKAAAGDPLGARRDHLNRFCNINHASLQAVADLSKSAGYAPLAAEFTHAIEGLTAMQSMARNELYNSPPPPVLPAAPACSADDAQLAGSLGVTSLAQINAVMAEAVAALSQLRKAWTETKALADAATVRVNQLNQHVGAWRSYETALPNHESAVLRAEAEWARWDAAAKLIETAERKYSQEVGNTFANTIGDLSGLILSGRRVTVDLENGMKIGTDPIELLSESTRWRAEVATLAAIAQTVRCPLLVIDGADILDDRNKGLFVQFLLDRICPLFEHVLLTATVKGKIEDERPSSNPAITKWTIRQGELARLVP